MDQSSKSAEIARRVRALIHDGTLRQGDAVPSTRALAAEWGVARGTVTAAYEQLDGEGYLRTRQGAPTRVAADVGAPAAGAGPTPAPVSRPESARAAAALAAGPGSAGTARRVPATGPAPAPAAGPGSARAATPAPAAGPGSVGTTTPATAAGPESAGAAGLESAGSVAAQAAGPGSARAAIPVSVGSAAAQARTAPGQGSGILDATPGNPSLAALSSADVRAAWRAALAAPATAATTPPGGVAALRDQLAAHLSLARGFGAASENVIVCAGTSEALSLLVEALRARLGRAPRIAVEDPGYIGGRAALASAGAVLTPVPVGGEGIDLTVLRGGPAPDAVMVTPTHQYPLGSVMRVARRRALLDWAARAGVMVIEDDYDSEFRHRGSPVPALAALDAAGAVVHLGSFSKVLDPRLRCAYVVAPPGPLGEALHAARTARGPVVAEPVQLALAHLMRTGSLRRHLGRARRDYAHKRDRIAARVSGVAGVRAAALQGGLHVVLTWTGRPAADVVAGVAARGIRIADLSAYAASPETAAALNGVVVGYGGISLTQVDIVLDAVFALVT
ncbi:MAG: PLP-dependent aminotransferase family protein [Pseudorhodoferax sp.]